ncbi:hypothetical protein ETAA8_56700 [Anatilimnocola aggregata]|uniref:Uncharacterized protein n=1 Tax=Anatilimnocola aggregata TaxID=2528021 RepID=A0A517YJX5_9BACT|nr:hypothetical protein [Anatilimnocola aggregata]QDU30525.1 hypothetical protein ETAA8_56700 [Anatilimnocola aggregata]
MQTSLSPAQRRLRVHWFALRLAVTAVGLLVIVLFSSLIVSLIAEETPPQEQAKQPTIDLKSIQPDLQTPAIEDAPPAAGKRVKQQLPQYRDSKLFHALYLPTDWTRERRWPVIVEYPGNGPYSNSQGDTNSGFVEDCNLAYGLSGGKEFICVTLPFVNSEKQEHQRQWWGNPTATVEYCLQAVELICRDFGGDLDQLVLCGFSRGAIACNYIGLRDERVAKLWKCFVVHSHYDGVRRWPYDDSDPESARARLARLAGRPQWISHESSIAATEKFLDDSQSQAKASLGQFTFVSLPFANHTDTWALRDIEPRRAVRAWLRERLK